MAERLFDIKWQKDLLAQVTSFTGFAFEGNIHDLHPILIDDQYSYMSLEAAIGQLLKDRYCVVFFDHTRQAGRDINDANIKEGEEIDDAIFNSFSFLEKRVLDSEGKEIANPNIALFRKFYLRSYVTNVKGSSDQSLQGGVTMDMRRIHDAMEDYANHVCTEIKKEEINGVSVVKQVYNSEEDEYKNTKPFLFILPNFSRIMTRPGDPDDKEHALLMMLYQATQIHDTPCKVVVLVDKMNDLPTWFEAEGSNPALKKINIPNPNSNFRETYYEIEMKPMMQRIEDENKYLNALKKFSAYTEKYSLIKLEQLKTFINNSASEDDHNLTKIDKTVFKFEYGESENPWRNPKMFLTIDGLEEKLKATIKGQDHVAKQIVQTLRSAVTGVNSSKKNDRRPKAVFFLAGPTGTGKTEMCKTLAEQLFGSPERMVRFDMSEFREVHNESRLFGAPPGYIGYEAGGELTKAIKENPFSLLLFDEIEKAADRIWDKFLQILGDGRVTDGKGETVYFSECIIVFTSNLGMTATEEITGSAKISALNHLSETEEGLITKINETSDEGERKANINALKEVEIARAGINGLRIDMLKDKYFSIIAKDNKEFPFDSFCKFSNELVLERINDYFEHMGRREILGRIGEKNIMVYNFIDKDVSAKTIADVTISRVIDHLANENQIALDLDVSDKEVLDFIYAAIIDEKVINLGGRGISMTTEKLISDATGKYIFTKGLQYFKSLENSSMSGTDDMPRLKGKLIVKGKELEVIDA